VNRWFADRARTSLRRSSTCFSRSSCRRSWSIVCKHRRSSTVRRSCPSLTDRVPVEEEQVANATGALLWLGFLVMLAKDKNCAPEHSVSRCDALFRPARHCMCNNARSVRESATGKRLISSFSRVTSSLTNSLGSGVMCRTLFPSRAQRCRIVRFRSCVLCATSTSHRAESMCWTLMR